MAEPEMYEQEEVAAPKKGLPAWLWVCGSGCLLLVVVGIFGGVWVANKFKEFADPEKQWPKVAEKLHYDERPTHVNLVFGWDLGMDFYMFESANDDYVAVLMHFPAEDAENTYEQLFDPEFTGSFMGFGGRANLEPGDYTIQGKERKVLHFDQQSDGSGGEAGRPSVGPGRSIYVDLTPDGQTRPLILQLIRQGEGENFTQEEIDTFLEPFDVWHDG